ncbi:Daunorubicin/doxorubicin resistance ATP-binding protein DrrA [Pirellulimonas nuda]|uniref:Daunorubicin/doxorubicin resistance ATP-binding protein DrrA n=1 Tax=Pirellulimonas nuda TaxID=2528009 RepID=A0A518DB46_9BACT|nr:ATP-binding cassette domain-containing protein [Pirellulimonas nuda]QDU88704.1 Daunorubicin/doxorubicin resistance ATP-binding protein DrrA [Pirellulimonas nuda]
MLTEPLAADPASRIERPPRVVVSGLVKTYPDLQRGLVTAVDGLSFTAHAGEVFGLLGPNGAGKTTAMRILATLLRPSAGCVTIAGFDCQSQPDLVRSQIGFVSANTATYDRMTAWELVEFFGRLHGLNDRTLAERMPELFEKLEMTSIRDTLGAKMSTGMRQKTSIARALIHDPPVMIFDEATNGLDVLAARALLDVVSRLRDEGKCVIFSTHIMREAERLCDQIAIMHGGKILASGSLNELRGQHDEEDLEELFFQLIHRAQAEQALTQPHGGEAILTP